MKIGLGDWLAMRQISRGSFVSKNGFLCMKVNLRVVVGITRSGIGYNRFKS